MKIFVYEFVTGGGLAGQPLPSFWPEGELIWQALINDLISLEGVEVLTLRDDRLALPDWPDLPNLVVTVTNAERFANDFRHCLTMADAVWPVAPEEEGILECLNRDILCAGKRLLGCLPTAIGVTASKASTARHLAVAGINVVPTYSAPFLMIEEGSVVAKPDDGAGCQETLFFTNLDEAKSWAMQQESKGFIFQPYVGGQVLSLSLLCCEGRAQLLTVNCQHIDLQDDQFRFDGVTVNALADENGVYASLAAQVAASLPGLWGYVGIDLIETPSGPCVLEVNPRLTLSYAGLRAALDCNPAERVLLLPEMRPCRGIHAVQLETTHAC